jgi:multidrug efflux system outer membrane protein
MRAFTTPRAITSLALAATLLSGCNLPPKKPYVQPNYPAPPAFRGADDAAITSDPQNSFGDQQWSQVFQEPELQELIRKALANNYDVRIAAQHILEQDAQVRITRSQEFPSISIGGLGVGADVPALNSGSGSSSGGSSSSGGLSSPLAEGAFSLSASWTPDFWGLYRKQTEAQRDQLLAQTWAQRAVRMTLVQQVASAYLQLRAYDNQLAITQQTIKTRQQSVDLTTTLETGGAAPLSDVRQAEQLLYAATSQIPQLQQQIQQEENAIHLLLGENPGPIARQAARTITPPPQELPTGIPSQLLTRRPDIEQAESQLKAANANIAVARAQFFPALSLSASAGVGGNSFSNIFSTGSRTIYGLGQLSQPIFEGGKLRGQLNLSEATEQEMVLTYQKTIAGAYRDVSNALIALNKQRAYRIEQEKLVAAAQDSTRLARLRYQGGATGYLEVLTTDATLYSAQLSLVSAQQSEALALVQLYAALGGGWS